MKRSSIHGFIHCQGRSDTFSNLIEEAVDEINAE